ncbi:MAG: renalase [Psychrobacter glaciei]|jgi:renalase
MQSFPDHLAHKQIAIIGAGMSGLVAASKLSASGFEVAVFEKARGTGGRMGSKRVHIPSDTAVDPEKTITFDLGVSSFGPVSEEFSLYLNELSEQGVVIKNSRNHFVGTPRNSMITRYLSENINVNFGQKITRVQNKEGNWHIFAQAQQDMRQPQANNVTNSAASAPQDEFPSEVLIGTSEHLILAVPAEQANELLGESHESHEDFCNIKSAPSFVSTFIVQNVLADDLAALSAHSDSVVAGVSLEHDKANRESYSYRVIKLTTTSTWAAEHIDDGNDCVGEFLLTQLNQFLNKSCAKVVKQYTHRWLYSQYNQLIPVEYFTYQNNLHIVGDYFSPNFTTSSSSHITEMAEGVERAFLSASHLTKKLLHGRLVDKSSEDSLGTI